MIENLAMSTTWNSRRQENVPEMLYEISQLGLHCIEAGYKLTPAQIGQLVDLQSEIEFRTVSVHNFCPIPVGHECGWGDDFLLSSPDEEMRKSGVNAVLQTISLAEKLGAGVVVIHLGKVEAGREQHIRLKQLAAAGCRNTTEFIENVNEMKAQRNSKAGVYFDAARRTLDDLLPKLPKGIFLGLENRYEFYSIPIIPEMERLLKEYGKGIGYWHDMGHAHVQEFMGFCETGEHLAKLGTRLAGMHIHDAIGISDHMPPGSGEIDFGSIIPYINMDIPKVLELHPRVTWEEAKKGVEFLSFSALSSRCPLRSTFDLSDR